MAKKKANADIPPDIAQRLTIGPEDLTALTGLTHRRHLQMADEGYFPKPNRGQFQMITTFEGIIRFYREHAEKETLSKEKLLLTRAKREGEERRNAIETGEFKSVKEIAAALFEVGEDLKGTLNFQLVDRLPALNAGLDAGAQRKNNKDVFGIICKRFQEFAKKWTGQKNGSSSP